VVAAPAKFNPSVGTKVEAKDFSTNSWRSCKIIAKDEELQTFDVKFGDGVEGKGVPLGLLRERKSKKKSSRSAEGGKGVGGKVEEVKGMVEGLSDKQLEFLKTVIVGLKAL